MIKKDKNFKFSTGKNINNITVNKNWLVKVENFIKEATYDSTEKIFYMFEKDMKKAIRNPSFGYDKQHYPSSDSILIKSKKIDPRTNNLNNVFCLKEDDYWMGFSFFKDVHEKDIIEILTNIKMDLLTKIFKKNKKIDNEKYEKVLKTRASIGQLKINVNNTNKIINAVSFPVLLNLICSLSEILGIKFNKLECKRWSKSFDDKLVDDYDFHIVKKIESFSTDKNSNIDNIFRRLKGLRDLFAHYYEYKKTKEDRDKYLLLRSIYWTDSIYLIVVKNFSEVQIYEYKIANIVETIRFSLTKWFKNNKL